MPWQTPGCEGHQECCLTALSLLRKKTGWLCSAAGTDQPMPPRLEAMHSSLCSWSGVPTTQPEMAVSSNPTHHPQHPCCCPWLKQTHSRKLSQEPGNLQRPQQTAGAKYLHTSTQPLQAAGTPAATFPRYRCDVLDSLQTMQNQ